jgi:hypothetical protein
MSNGGASDVAAVCGSKTGGLDEKDGAVVAGGDEVVFVAGLNDGAAVVAGGAIAVDTGISAAEAPPISSSFGIDQFAISAGNGGSVSLIFR